jgi:hypothetical protein
VAWIPKAIPRWLLPTTGLSFDPVSRPGPLRDSLSSDDLEIMRDFGAEEIRARLGAELLARASAGLLEPAEELPLLKLSQAPSC